CINIECIIVYIEKVIKEEGDDIIKERIESEQVNKELYCMADKLAHELREFDYSKAYMREAITVDNDYEVAVIFLVNILKEENKIDEIIDLINELKRMGAEDPEYDWELALAYNENEEFEKAYDYYKLA